MARALHTSKSASIIRWLFVRGSRVLTCEVRLDERGSFDVLVVPLWDARAAVTESYDGAAGAMRRHAEITEAFRQAGWAVTRQRSPRATEVAA